MKAHKKTWVKLYLVRTFYSYSLGYQQSQTKDKYHSVPSKLPMAEASGFSTESVKERFHFKSKEEDETHT